MVSIIKYYLLILFIFMFSYNPKPAVSRVLHSNLTDLESLLAFKAGVSDPYDFLASNRTTDASFCDSWFGVKCSRRQRVVKLDIRNRFLNGTISPHLGNLSFLSYLNLQNNNLTGPIPSSIGRLPRLALLSLFDNQLSGTVPPTIFNTSSLSKLSLASNKLTGPLLPHNSDPFMLPRLQWISLSWNFLTGSIPQHFAQCSQLQKLSLSYNELSGSVPPELGNITGLQELYLGNNNLGGTIPASLGNLTMLQILEIGRNYMEGLIPGELGKLVHLKKLRLDRNNLTGSLPAALLNASNLEYFGLYTNKLNGIIPPTLGNYWPQLTYLNMCENQLIGGLDFITSLSNCKKLEEIVLNENKLDGILPDSVGNLSTTLYGLYLGDSYIQGKISIGIGNLSGLVSLGLQGNELAGEVPSTLSKLKRLQGIGLDHNRLSGTIPIELGVMTGLNALFLSDNALSGSIPYSLGNITSLQYLYLDSNRLFSKIPESLWNLSDLLELNLSNNTIDGLLPPQIKNLKCLDKSDLSNNRLTGNIPSALGELQMLTYLNLSSNSFYNQIPISIKGLISIEYLNLSYNALSGTIPEVLANLSHLLSLDLSFNKLEGQIPQGGAFSNLSMLSLEGNKALCGAIQLSFPPCPSKFGTSPSKSKSYLLKYILSPVAIVGLLACCLYVGLVLHRKRINKLELDTLLNGFRIISYYELVRATDHFSDANLLGRGSFASVFKAYLDNGSITAVKVLNLEDQDALRSFDVECRVLGKVRHRNLVKIINTCSNLDFKALILDFMPNGSLEQWLYSHNNYMNLLQRLNIMLDVSLALEYLHHDHPQIIVHCDLKPSNVLLDENMTAQVSDFGISKLFLGDSKSILSASAPGTFGYMAPEYKSMGRVSRKSDVYSFGILLLETLTRKKPSDHMFEGGLSLRQWVSKAYPDAVLEIVDPNLLTEASSTRRQPDSLTNVHECLSTLIELGLQCSRNLPKERIMMKDVVPILENIRTKYLLARPSA